MKPARKATPFVITVAIIALQPILGEVVVGFINQLWLPSKHIYILFLPQFLILCFTETPNIAIEFMFVVW